MPRTPRARCSSTCAERRYSDEMLAALDVPRSLLPRVFESPEVTGRVTAQRPQPDRPAGRHPRRRRRRRQCLRRDRRRADRRGPRRLLDRHLGHAVRARLTPAHRPRGRPQRLLRRGAGRLSPDGRHPRRRRRAQLVPRRGRRLRGRRCVNGLDPFAVLLDEAAAVPAGADGLLFLPYLAGERSPHIDPPRAAPGSGLSLAHDRRHMLRALIEGVGFAFADCLERMRALGVEPPDRSAHRRRCRGATCGGRSWRPSCGAG